MSTISHKAQVGAQIHVTKEAPNIIPNGGLQEWNSGTTVQPDGWADEGTPAILRDTGTPDNWNAIPYSVKYTDSGSGGDGGKFTFSNLKANTKYGVHVKAKATAGDTAQMLTTGAGTDIDTETLLTSFTDLFGTFETDGTPVDVVLKLIAKNANDIVWFTHIMVVEGDVQPTFAPQPGEGGLPSPTTDLEVNSLGVGATPTGTAGTIKVAADGWIGKGAASPRVTFPTAGGVLIEDASLGINITPSFKMHMAESNGAVVSAIDCYDDSNTTFASLYLRKSATDTKGSAVATADTEELGTVSFFGVNTSNAWAEAARINVTQESSDANFVWGRVQIGMSPHSADLLELIMSSTAPLVNVNGKLTVTETTLPFEVLFNALSVSSNVAKFNAFGSASPTDNDEGYISYFLRNSTPAEKEYARLTWKALDVTVATEDGQLIFSTQVAGSLTTQLTLGNNIATVGTLSVASGSVTDSSGAISFGNENLTTTGSVTANSFITASNIGIAADPDLIQLTAADTVQINGKLGIGVSPSTLIHATENNAHFHVQGVANELFISSNAYWTGAQWNRSNISYGVAQFYHDQNSPDSWTIRMAESGANPVSFTTVVKFLSDGQVLMPQVYSDTIGGTNIDLFIDNTGKLGAPISSKRYKKHFRYAFDTSWIYNLKPVLFDMKDDSAKDQIGLIAEDVNMVYNKLVSYERIDMGGGNFFESDIPRTVVYSRLITPMLTELQKINERLKRVEELIDKETFYEKN